MAAVGRTVIIVAHGREVNLLALAVEDTDIQCQSLKLLNKHLKGLGHTGRGNVLTLDNSLVSLAAAGDIVRLDRKDLLQGISGTVSLQCPHLHLTEALATELGLTAQGLLGDKRVRTVGTSVDLIVHEVMQLEVVHDTHGNGVIKGLAGAAVVQDGLTVKEAERIGKTQGLDIGGVGLLLGGEEAEVGVALSVGDHFVKVLPFRVLTCVERTVVACHTEALGDVALICAVEHGGHDLPAQTLGGNTKVHLQHLTDVHTGRHAQGVEHDIQRRTVGQEGHILGGQDAGYDTLITMAACHLITHGDLTLLSDVDLDHAVHAGGQIIAGLAREHTHVHDHAGLAVRQAQGGVTHLAGLLTEDSAQEAFLSGQLSLTLGGDLTDENVAGTHLGTLLNDTLGVEVLQDVLTDVGDLAGDLLRPELGVAGLVRVLFNVNRGIDVVTNQSLVEQDGVLVVIAFPGHKADKGILTQSDLTVCGCRTVSNHLAGLDRLAIADDGTLVEANALVGTLELAQLVGILCALVGDDDDLISLNALHATVVASQNHHAGIHGGLIFHTGTDNRRIRHHQRHSLLLHVCAHECTGVIVVLKEGDHSGGNRHHHLRRHVHIINASGIDGSDLGGLAGGDLRVDEAAVLVQRLVCLRDDVAILHVSGHVYHLVSDAVNGLALRVRLMDNLTVGSLDKAVLADTSVGSQIGDQTDVRTFGGLDGAHTAVVGVVHVTNVEGGTVTGQTAGTQSRETAAVSQLGQGVVLISKLRELRGAEELTDNGGHGTDVDQRLWGQLIVVLRGHALLDDLLHTDKADAELILELLTHRADTAVAEVVDVIDRADVMGKIEHIVNGSENIVLGDVLGAKLGGTLANHLLEQIQVALSGLSDLTQDGNAHALLDAAVSQVATDDVLRLQGVVGKHLHGVAVVHLNADLVDTGALHGQCVLRRKDSARGEHHLARQGRDGILGQLTAGNTAVNGHLLVELIAADRGDIVSLGVKEIVVDKGLSGLNESRLAGTELLIDLLERLHVGRGVRVEGKGLALVLLKGSLEAVILTQKAVDLLTGLKAERADKHGDRDLTGLVDTDVDHAVDIRLILQPCATVGDDLGGVGTLTGLVDLGGVVHTGRADDLGDDDTLGTVDNKGTVFGHEGELTHKDIGLLDLTRLLVGEADIDLEGSSVVNISLLALLHGVVRLGVQAIGDELDQQVSGEISDGGDLVQDLGQALLEEPLIGLRLDLHKVGQLQIEAGTGEGFTGVLAESLIFQLDH